MIDDGDREKAQVVSKGTLSAFSVLPEFTARDLARLETHGQKWFANNRSVRVNNAIFEAQKRTIANMQAIKKTNYQDRLADEKAVSLSDDGLVVKKRSWVQKLTGNFKFGGVTSAWIPWHATSIRSSSVLTPILASGRSLLDGEIIGVDHFTGVPFRFDPWSAYRKHMVTSVNAMIAGLMGSGKSVCLKTLAIREIAYGRHIIIEGDPKGEWARVAEALGGQVISVGNGNYLNPLDAGVKPENVSVEQWQNVCADLRISALRSLITAIRSANEPLVMAETAVLDKVVEYFAPVSEPTIVDLVNLLLSTWVENSNIRGLDTRQARIAANSLILVFNRLIEGTLKGNFEKKSTVRIDTNAPIIVFNTGSIDEHNDVKRATYVAVMSAAIDRICYSHDGLFRLVIAEEGWNLLSNPELVAGWDKRIRLSGELGVSNWMLVHELADLDKFANEGSGLKAMIQGIFTKSEIMILYRQSSASISTLEKLIEDITSEELSVIDKLPQGVGLWRVGKSLRQLVFPMMSDEAFKLFNTDKGRKG